MPITLVEITTIPIADDPDATTFHDEDFCTLEIVDSLGRIVARPRVSIADVDLGGMSASEMRTSIDEDGPKPIAVLALA